MKTSRWLVVVTVLSIGLAACAANLPGAGGNASQAVCQALDTLVAPLEEVAAVGVDATAADATAVKERLDGAFQAVERANQALNSEPIAGLLEAYDNLAADIDELPDDAVLGEEASATIRSGVENIQATLAQATSALDCQ